MSIFVWFWSNTLFLERTLVCGINNGPFLQPYGYKLRFHCRKCEIAFQPSQAFAEQSRKSEVTSLALIYKFHGLCGNKLHTILRHKSGGPLREVFSASLCWYPPKQFHFHQRGWACPWSTSLILLLNQRTRWSASSHWSGLLLASSRVFTNKGAQFSPPPAPFHRIS